MTREEVEVWVNPSAWDDPDEAARVIEEILSSGSTDEAEWVRIAGGRDEDIAAADERAWGAVEELIHRELGAYREATAKSKALATQIDREGAKHRLNKEEVKRYSNELRNIPAYVSTKVAANGMVFAELPLTVSAEEIVAAIAVAMEDIDVNEIIGECAAARPSVAAAAERVFVGLAADLCGRLAV